ncbi:LysR family transcriptional regulator [Actibacterium pelagium]|uniref:LysR family transcriptional regulator n=1 Tax=Actibacterium pelagium TaxID=2029103 RepID=A0A917AA93_9RHOB|nr:LysR family transcriptional regulator [Actibacterium pelagium]GGE38445.1 LysR family transcriptional regulator [Actibacterium pelagium]
MTLDTRQLRYFLEIAEQGSITRASQVLNVAQPALSMHLRTLEENLGTQLMLRNRTGVVPTEAGRLLVERARRILDEMARTEDDIRTLESDPSGVVRVGLPGTVSSLVSLPLIHAVRERYPNITINIAEAMSGFIAGWMVEDRIDLSILYHALDEKGFRSDVLLEEELVVLWGQEADNPAKVALKALKGVAMVLPSRGHGLRELIEDQMRRLGFAPEVAIEIDSYANIKSLVAEGFGPSILPTYAVQAETLSGTIRTSQIADPGLWRRAHLIQPTNRPVTRAQSAVTEVLQDVVADLMANGKWAGARVASVS